MFFQILETAFKKETVGLVTREQYVEKVSQFVCLYAFLNFQHHLWLINCSCISVHVW